MKDATKTWIDLAHEDYIDMNIMMKQKRYRGAVIFAQQAVEKLLKAYILEHTDTIPKKTHFIEKLIADAELDLAEINNPEVDQLSTAYAWARYADISQAHFKTEKDVKPLLEMANILYLWIENKLKKI